jgi:hypothetical protein
MRQLRESYEAEIAAVSSLFAHHDIQEPDFPSTSTVTHDHSSQRHNAQQQDVVLGTTECALCYDQLETHGKRRSRTVENISPLTPDSHHSICSLPTYCLFTMSGKVDNE